MHIDILPGPNRTFLVLSAGSGSKKHCLDSRLQREHGPKRYPDASGMHLNFLCRQAAHALYVR